MQDFDCTCKLWDSAPAAMPMFGYVVHELLIFLRRPEPLPQLLLVAAGVPPHWKQCRSWNWALQSAQLTPWGAAQNSAGNPPGLRTPLSGLWLKGGIIVDELLIWAHIVVSDRVELVGERQQLLPTDIRIWRKALVGLRALFPFSLQASLPNCPPSFKAGGCEGS